MRIGLIFFVIVITTTAACNYQVTEGGDTADAYTPGLGELMMTIQARHAKLYYSGAAANWELASFYVHELEEAFEDVVHYHPEDDGLDMQQYVQQFTRPALDMVERAISERSVASFENSFSLLTNSCNSCHGATNHAFIKIKIPDGAAFPNQEFASDTIAR